MQLVVACQDSCTCNTSEDIGSSTLEEGSDSLVDENFFGTIDRSAIFFSLAGCHHHSSSDGVDRIRSETSADSDHPPESEVDEEVVVERFREDGSNRIVNTEVESSIDDDTNTRDNESSVEPSDSVSGECFLIHVNEAVELLDTSLFGVLQVIGESSSGIIQGIDEQERDRAGSTSRSEISNEPNQIPVFVFVFIEESFEVVLE